MGLTVPLQHLWILWGSKPMAKCPCGFVDWYVCFCYHKMLLHIVFFHDQWISWLSQGGSGENDGGGVANRSQYQPQGRWAVQSDPLAIRTVLEMKSMQLPLSHTPSRAVGEEEFEEDSRFHPQSFDSLLDEDVDDLEEEEKICSVSY